MFYSMFYSPPPPKKNYEKGDDVISVILYILPSETFLFIVSIQKRLRPNLLDTPAAWPSLTVRGAIANSPQMRNDKRFFIPWNGNPPKK
jgi:hypothetical protein